MKLLQISAQTLPLWISKIGEKPPPLCGCMPPEPNYIAKVCAIVFQFLPHVSHSKLKKKNIQFCSLEIW